MVANSFHNLSIYYTYIHNKNSNTKYCLNLRFKPLRLSSAL